MATHELTMADDGDIEMHEQIVTDSPVKREQDGESEQNPVGPISNDDTNTSKELNHSPEPTQPSKRITRRPKRRPRYQTQDLVREISPQPPGRIYQEFNNDAENESGTTTEKHQGLSNSTQNNQPCDENQKQPDESPQLSMINGKRTVQCNICKKQMTESRLANHIRLLHVEKKDDENSPDTKRKEFRCEYCGKSYAIKYTYDQHVRTHIEGRPKCPECGSTFASAFSLFRHRAKVHNLEHNYTTHNCDQCDRTFFSVSELTLHKQRHSTRKDHKCPECDKAFSVKGNLKMHMRTHAKEKLYKCDICDSSFSHPYSLVSHRRIHTNEYPYACEECGKNYRSKHQLTSHMLVHTDKRPFKCDECSKTFRSRTAFKMHQDQHKGIKRFTCKFCERKFQCHANKLKHERRHIGEKRHKCDHCDKAFIEKQELKNHMKVHERVITEAATTTAAATKSNSSRRESKKVVKIEAKSEVPSF